MEYSNMSLSKSLVSGGASNAMNSMKYETASELSISVPQNDYWGNVSSRDCGRVGGNMTRKLVALGKQQLQ